MLHGERKPVEVVASAVHRVASKPRQEGPHRLHNAALHKAYVLCIIKCNKIGAANAAHVPPLMLRKKDRISPKQPETVQASEHMHMQNKKTTPHLHMLSHTLMGMPMPLPMLTSCCADRGFLAA